MSARSAVSVTLTRARSPALAEVVAAPGPTWSSRPSRAISSCSVSASDEASSAPALTSSCIVTSPGP